MNKDIKRLIQNYQYKNIKMDDFILKVCQKEFDEYTKNLFLHATKYDKYLNSKWFLVNIINHLNDLLNIELNYTIIENNLLSIKSKNVFITISQSKISNSILRLLHDISYTKILNYILYLNKELKDIKHNQKLWYPYLNKYSKVTNDSILLHYSNLVD